MVPIAKIVLLVCSFSSIFHVMWRRLFTTSVLIIYLFSRLVHTTILKAQCPCKLIGQLRGGGPQKRLLQAPISLVRYQGCPGKWPKELVVSRQDKHL